VVVLYAHLQARGCVLAVQRRRFLAVDWDLDVRGRVVCGARRDAEEVLVGHPVSLSLHDGILQAVKNIRQEERLVYGHVILCVRARCWSRCSD
jgi:hypothetical protein